MDNIIIYNTDDGNTRVQLYANDGTVWMTQAQIAELFDKERSGISKHISNIFREGELDQKSNVSFFTLQIQTNQSHFISLKLFLLSAFASALPAAHNFANGPIQH